MGIFSKTCEYAMRAVFYIAKCSQEDQKCGLKEIAQNIDSPESFLAKILQRLTKQGIVQSHKGPQGGFFIHPESFERPLADIVIAIEGDEIFKGCGMGLSYCSESNPCPLHAEFKKVRNQLTHMLYSTSIGKFNIELLNGNYSLNK